MTKSTNTMDSFGFLLPKSCPFQLFRIGGNLDGAYLVPDDLDGIEACFSPGVNNHKDFEDELADRYGIKSHMCDFTSDEALFRTPLKPLLQTFRKKWLDVDGGPHSITLEQWVAEEARSGDLLLQIDIEGGEYRNLLATPQEILRRFRIIVMELHGVNVVARPADYPQQLQPLLEKLGQDFVCIHARANNCCGEEMVTELGLNVPLVLEVTLLRRDRLEQRPAANFVRPSLPHPADITRNVEGKPPLFLNLNWTGGYQTIASALKSLSDWRDFSRFLIEQQEKQSAKFDRLLAALSYPATAVEIRALEGADLIELAEGCEYRLSSSHGGWPLNGIVLRREPFFFHTEVGAPATMTIDLGGRCAIAQIVLHNRTDMLQWRAEHLLYVLHDHPAPESGRISPLTLSNEFYERVPKPTLTHVNGTVGRYLTVFTVGIEPMHLSGIEVFGKR
jgi:hypothetical protein